MFIIDKQSPHIHIGPDDLLCSMRIQTKNNELVRLIVKVCILEIVARDCSLVVIRKHEHLDVAKLVV